MSTRANVLIKDEHTTLYFYRHSDGYLEETGESLKQFVRGYTTGLMRLDTQQSAGWLILQGHCEYNESPTLKPVPESFSGWKVGAYEPTDRMSNDVAFIYIIDLEKKTLTCRTPKSGFWDKADLKNTVKVPNFCVSFERKSQ